MSPLIPPADGTVTLPEVIDFHTKHNHDSPIFIFSEDGKSEPTQIAYLEFGRACDRVAHKMRPGRRGPEGELVAVLALSDTLLYHAVCVGMMRAGMIPFMMSPRNTATATVKMLKKTGCHKLVTTQETLKSLVAEVKGELAANTPGFELLVEEMPPILEIYPKMGRETKDDTFEAYPKPAVRPPLDTTLLYLHSSGSIGFPKPIAQTFRMLCNWASFPQMPEMAFYTIGCMSLPAFHTLGIVGQLLHPMYGLSVIALYPPTALTSSSLPIMPTPDNILEHLRRTKVEALFAIPAHLQIWAQEEHSVDLLANLKLVVYAGASFPTKLGNLMTSGGVTLCQLYGATEVGGPNYALRRPAGDDGWEWITMDDRLNVRWHPQGDGTYECQFLTSEFHQVAVENIPDVKGYATSDLFIPHPTTPNFWKLVGRKDDVIIHTSGEKTVPAPMENIIWTSQYTMGVVIFGSGHDQPGVLIELKPTHVINPSNEDEVIKARNLVWPIVEEANKVAPAFSRIFKEFVIFTSPNKPLPRAGKGTVMRKAALALYHEEIEALYTAIDSIIGAGAFDSPSSWLKEDTENWLKNQVDDIVTGKVFTVSGDLFDQGMDSLSATILRRRIVAALQANKSNRKAADRVSQNTIYNNPSIEQLSRFLVDAIAEPESHPVATSKTDSIEEMIAKYTIDLEQPIPAGTAANATIVLITGTTGNLGSQILETLLRDSSVRKIYALNRKSTDDAHARHVEQFNDKGLEVGLLLSDNLVFLEGDMTQKDIGLPREVYQELLDSVNVIIHNAWKLDFNLQLASFGPNICGTRNLLNLARASAAGSATKFLFASSVASATSWDRSRGAVPEEVVTDPQFAIGTGYGESKYVAERIVSQSGVQATSFRIGQIAGGQPKGAWAITNWVPILVKSSIALNALPSMVGVSSWVPMHSVAQSIVDVALSKSPAPPVLNIAHPRPTSFSKIFSAINEALVEEGIFLNKMPLVAFREWFSLLETRATSRAKDMKDVPAIKLVDFFRSIAANEDLALRLGQEEGNGSGSGIPEFSTTKAQAMSKAMENMPIIGWSEAQMWVRYWKSAGLFA